MTQEETRTQSFQIPQIRVTREEGQPIQVDIGGQYQGHLRRISSTMRQWDWEHDKRPEEDAMYWVWSALDRFEELFGYRE